MFNKTSDIFLAPAEEADVISQIATSLPEISVGEWQEQGEEGQLAVDVLETEGELVVVAALAGTRPEDISLHLHNDFLTIRARREGPVSGAVQYFNQECFWGAFSRTIVLPVDVKSELASSEYKNGVLVIRLPKTKASSNIPILVIEE